MVLRLWLFSDGQLKALRSEIVLPFSGNDEGTGERFCISLPFRRMVYLTFWTSSMITDSGVGVCCFVYYFRYSSSRRNCKYTVPSNIGTALFI